MRTLTPRIDSTDRRATIMVPKNCTVLECGNFVGPKGARGWCTKHYQMWRLTGNPCGSTAPTTAQRFWAKVNKNGPTPLLRPDLGQCWIWTNSTDDNGYGMFKDSRTHRSHRWAYESLVGPIPEGLVLDHLCRITRCVNPGHLEPVTNDENLERGWGRRIKSGWINNCISGHEYTSENTYVNPKGRLICRACASVSRRRYEQRKAA